MFGFGKKRVTHKEMADGLYNFVAGITCQMTDQALGSKAMPFKNVDKTHFSHEWMILMFWIIHRMHCGCDDKHLMLSIHKNYFDHCGFKGVMFRDDKQAALDEWNLMLSRYGEYDAAFDPSAGGRQFLLGGTIAKNILEQHEVVLDDIVQFAVAIQVLLYMKEIKEICDKYKVSD